MSDTRGEFWQFSATDLKPGSPYRLALADDRGRALCEPWELSTFPAADATPDRFRVLFFTCAGGPDSPNLTSGNLPIAIRNRLLRRDSAAASTFFPGANWLVKGENSVATGALRLEMRNY